MAKSAITIWLIQMTIHSEIGLQDTDAVEEDK
jgi:hypothetical protein